MKLINTMLMSVMSLLIAVGLSACGDDSDINSVKSAAEEAGEMSAAEEAGETMIVPSITCEALAKDFEANEMRALRDHQNKVYFVSGKVVSVGADVFDQPEISLSDGKEFSFNSCLASPAEGEEFYYDLTEGQLVEMVCEVTGEVMGSPTLEGCSISD